MSYEVPKDAKASERLRHRYLDAVFGGETRRFLDRIGIQAGWHCLDVGAGIGSVLLELARRVGPDGLALGVDIDDSLHAERLDPMPANVRFERHDILHAPPEGRFDFVHARGLLEHLPEPQRGLDHILQALRPGGWILISDADWSLYDKQTLPEPFGEFMRVMRALIEQGLNDHQRDLCGRLLPMLQAAGLEELESAAFMWDMRGGEPSCEWFMLALEWAAPALGDAGLIDIGLARRAIAQAREPGFHVLSPVSVSICGRKPE